MRYLTCGWELGHSSLTNGSEPRIADADAVSNGPGAMGSVETVTGLRGGKALRINLKAAYGTYVRHAFTAIPQGTEMWIRFAIMFSDLLVPGTTTEPKWICKWGNLDTPVGLLCINQGTKTLSLHMGDEIQLTPSADFVTLTDQWYMCEIHWKTHATEGIAELKVNGRTAISFTGNTRISGPTNLGVDNIWFGCGNSFSGTGAIYMYIDDLAIADDADSVKPGHVTILRPTSNSSVQWTPTPASSNWDRVNDLAPVSYADYVSTSAADKRDEYVAEDITAATFGDGDISQLLVRDVGVVSMAKSDVAESMSNLVKLSGTDTIATARSLPTSWVPIRDSGMARPGGGAWVLADVNSTLLGILSA